MVAMSIKFFVIWLMLESNKQNSRSKTETRSAYVLCCVVLCCVVLCCVVLCSVLIHDRVCVLLTTFHVAYTTC
jgi:hypothetical protein